MPTITSPITRCPLIAIAVISILLSGKLMAGLPFTFDILRDAVTRESPVFTTLDGDNVLDSQSRVGAMYLLALACYYDENQVIDGRTIKAALLDKLDSCITGGQEPACRGVLHGRADNSVAQTLLLVRKKDSLWNSLTTDQQERCDLLMEALAITGNWCHNFDNDWRVDLSGAGEWNKLWNPNIQEGYVGVMIAAMEYFGINELNQILLGFDYDAIMLRLSAKGFTNIQTTWAITGKSLMENGGVDSLGGTGLGVALEFTLEDYITGNEIAADPWDIYCSLARKMYYHTVVNDGHAYINAYLDNGSSPVLGEAGMCFEFDAYDEYGRRSDAAYVYDGWKNSIITFSALRVLGIANSNANDWANISDRIRVGSTDLLYKLKHGYHSHSMGKDTFHDESFWGDGSYAFQYATAIWRNLLVDYDSMPAVDQNPEFAMTSYEAESLGYLLSGGSQLTVADLNSSGEAYASYDATGSGDWIEYTIPNVAPGSYQVVVSVISDETAGIYQMAINGSAVGASIDYYKYEPGAWTNAHFVELTSLSDLKLRFTCEGQNISSLGDQMLVDQITLVALVEEDVNASTAASISHEFESLNYTNGSGPAMLYQDAYASGGSCVRLDGYGIGAWIEFSIPNVPAGIYELKMLLRDHGYSGIYQMEVNGNPVGVPVDYYIPTGATTEYSYLNIAVPTAGTVTLRFTCTGQNANALGYRMYCDQLELIPMAPGAVSEEFESLSFTSGSGPALVYQDSNASGGNLVRLNGYGVGAWVEFSIPNVAVGTYDLKLLLREHGYSGIYQMEINGTPVGDPVDYYVPTAAISEYTYLNIPITTPGTATIRFICTGQNSNAIGYRMYCDQLDLIPSNQQSGDLYEFESLASTFSGNSNTVVTRGDASAQAYVEFDASGSASWVEFTIPNIEASHYILNLGAYRSEDAGEYQLAVNGVDAGLPADYFSGTQSGINGFYADVVQGATGPLTLRFTCTGKSTSASGYGLLLDSVSLMAVPEAVSYTTYYPLGAWGEFEDLSFVNGGGPASVYQDAYASGGSYVRLNGYGSGAWIEFSIPNVSAGLYELKMLLRDHGYSGIYQMEVNGSPLGGPVDYYIPTGATTEYRYLNVPVSTSGTTTIRFTCVGQNANALGYRMYCDQLELTPLVQVEAESLPVTSSGISVSNVSDNSASGGTYVFLENAAVGDFVEFTLPATDLGVYSLALSYSEASDAAFQVSVDGIDLGEPVSFASGANLNVGDVKNADENSRTLRFTCTDPGTNSASLKLDCINLIY